MKRSANAPISIEAEYEQVEDAGSAGRVIDRQPQLTQWTAQRPVSPKHVSRTDWHDESTDGQIGNGQAQDEHVTHL